LNKYRLGKNPNVL